MTLIKILLFVWAVATSAFAETLTVTPTFEYADRGTSTLRSGFYRVANESSPANPFGPVLYLHNDVHVQGNPADRKFVRGIKGVFGRDCSACRIETKVSERGNYHYEWTRPGARGAVTDLDVSSDSNTVTMKVNWDSFLIPQAFNKGRVQLEYLGQDEQALKTFADSRGLSCFQPAQTSYISHRGSSKIETTNNTGIFPSNTEKAFDTAVREGYSGFELDVHLSSDGHFIVSHDNDLSVSSTCSGPISEKKSTELSNCWVKKSGLLPESGIAADWASVSDKLPKLEDVLQRFLPRGDVGTIVVDIKPGDVEKQAQALRTLFNKLPPEKAQKVVFLGRDRALTKYLQTGDYKVFALEGETGWEPLQTGERPMFLNAPEKNGVSVSMGLGFALAGSSTASKVVNGVSGVPNAAYNADLDIGYVHWSKENLQEMRRLLNEAHRRQMPVVGWTVNGLDKNKTIRQWFPDLDYLLSDSPYSTIAQVQIEKFMDAYTQGCSPKVKSSTSSR